MDIWEAIVDCRARGEAAALATIVSTLGSTPGKNPMKMLVRADGSFVGSVGGGCLEAEVWEHAREVMLSHQTKTVSFTLNEKDDPESGLICGGTVTIFIEPVVPAQLHLFGAGHVGAATARLAAEAGFGVSVHDDRPDMLDAERLPAPIRAHGGSWDELAADARLDQHAFVIVLTRGHADDEVVLRALAKAGVEPRFLGMIGSSSKRKLLLGRLAEEGIPQAWLERIVSPVGLPIGAKTAPEIAVSIVAQLLAEVRGPGARDASKLAEQGRSVGRRAPSPP